jgi:hypothetical protein
MFNRISGLAVMAALAGVCGVHAHEIGTTRVTVVFDQRRTYDITIVTDAASLVDKLEALAGSTLPSENDAARLQALLNGFDGSFRRRVKVSFDGSEVRPAIAHSVAPA